MNKNLRILVCPLNWGLGHATRMIPVIQQLLDQQNEVIIAADGDALEFLRKEFPYLKSILLPQYKVRYSCRNSQVISMIIVVPAMILSTIKEHLTLKKIVQQEHIDCVISDNRYGLWSKSAHSVFVTHQLRVKFPGYLKVLEPLFQIVVKSIIRHYDECWIPDLPGEFNYSGELSHPLSLKNQVFIGPLSRFKATNQSGITKKKYDFAVILSGPEPQRSLLELKIYSQLKIKNYKAAFVRGIQDGNLLQPTENIDVFERLNSIKLQELIDDSDFIICRSGYSSIMDMIRLRKTAVLIPTPGQTEQEYLADYLHKKGLFFSISQKEFCIDNAMQNKISFNAENRDDQGAALTQCILDLENRINKIKNHKRRN